MSKKIILLDGGMGQELIRLSKSKPHPLWSTFVMLEEPELVQKVHEDYIKAGASVITLNTYSTTPDRLEENGMADKFSFLQLWKGSSYSRMPSSIGLELCTRKSSELSKMCGFIFENS